MNEPLTYSKQVDYSKLDPSKRRSMQAAAQTFGCLNRLGYKIVEWSIGESVALVETDWGYLGLVVEGVGTKPLVADDVALMDANGITTYYDAIAQCNAAMAFNDLITLGVRPVLYSQYKAVQNGNWLEDKIRDGAIVDGTKNACILGQCAWGGGETPALNGIIVPGTVDLAGALMGVITKKEQVINPGNIKHGDVIFLLESSGIHANGLTLARKIAEKLAKALDPRWRKLLRKIIPSLAPAKKSVTKAYQTPLDDGRMYGVELLNATHIYCDIIEECIDAGIFISYCVNVTGHGWRKLMRALGDFAYVLERIPTPQPIFRFIQHHAKLSAREMYETYNMNAGFAVYVRPEDADRFAAIAEKYKGRFRTLRAGYIEDAQVKKVLIMPVGIEFAADTLAVR